MTERITKADLDRQIRDLNSTRWVHRGLSADAPDYSLDWAYGGVRVVDDNGSRDVTARGTKRDRQLHRPTGDKIQTGHSRYTKRTERPLLQKWEIHTEKGDSWQERELPS